MFGFVYEKQPLAVVAALAGLCLVRTVDGAHGSLDGLEAIQKKKKY